MAIKVKKAKERMAVLYPSLNLSNPKLNAIVVKISKQIADDADDDQIDETIKNFNEVFGFETVVKESKELSKLQKAAKSKGKETKTNDDDDDDDPDEETAEEKAAKAAAEAAKKDGEKVPAWAQALIESNKKLSNQVEDFKSGQVLDTKTTNARKLFEENEVIKKLSKKQQDLYFKTLDIDDEDTPIEDQITDLVETIGDFTQEKKDDEDLAGPAPTVTVDAKKPTEAEIDAIVG